MIDRIDQDWEVKYEAAAAPIALEASNGFYSSKSYAKESKSKSPRVDYTPKPLKLVQNISVMYEMK